VLLAKKVALVVVAFALVALLVSRIDFARDMHRLDAGMLGGAKDGNYHTLVGELASLAANRAGRIQNLESAGSAENIARLVAARKGRCDVAFALVQDGSDFKSGGADKLELVGRLPKAESVFFLGKDADKRVTLASLAGAKVGIGPEGSGVATLAGQLFALDDLAGLGIVPSHHSVADGLALAERGELDLAMVVIDEDAPLVTKAVREGRLQIAGLSNLDVVARRLPHFRTGRIGAGQYQAVKVLPAEDKRVLRVETLVVGNGCAGRSATIDLLSLLGARFPDFLRHNKDTPNATGLELTSSSKGFFEHGGPELADEFVPWLVDIMPPANWAYIVMAVSVLFNIMNAGHRFRLWRIDDARVKLESELSDLFGRGATLGDIQRTEISGALAQREARKKISALITRFEALGSRSRRQSLSMLVPMGQEMAYRYQEGVIDQTLAVLRAFLSRWDRAAGT
jgi:TRAP-type uncharacterized transport system substrate-binding protein